MYEECYGTNFRMLWEKCLPHAITKFIYLGENYNNLGDLKLTYQKANTVVKNFIEENSNNINLLKIKLEEHFKTIHHIYSLLYPKIYNRVNVFGIKSKNDFHFVGKLESKNTEWSHQK